MAIVRHSLKAFKLRKPSNFNKDIELREEIVWCASSDTAGESVIWYNVCI